MEGIKVSVLISAYNIEQYIGECIASIQKQDFDSTEIICVDDCSTDGTVAVINDYMSKDDRIILVQYQENGGPAKARNAGCRRAKGKYIWFIDGDDYIKDGALSKLYRLAEENNLDVLSFSGEAFVDKAFKDGFKYAEYKDFYKRKTKFDGVFTGQELFSEYASRGEVHGNLCLQFIKKDFFDKKKLYTNEDIRYNEDSPFSIYMFAKRCMCIPDVFYMRRFRPNSQVTRKKDFKDAESAMLCLAIELNLWESLDIPVQLNSNIEKYFLTMWNDLQNKISAVPPLERQFCILNKYPAVKYMMNYFILDKSWYNELTDELLSNLAEEDNIVLYGAGTMADTVAGLLDRRGITQYSVVVTNRTDFKKFHSRDVIEASKWEGDWKKSIVIIAVKSISAKEEITRFLKVKECKQIIKL